MKLFNFWLLQSSVWVEQEPIEAKNRKVAVEMVRSSSKRGTWKLRLVA